MVAAVGDCAGRVVEWDVVERGAAACAGCAGGGGGACGCADGGRTHIDDFAAQIRLKMAGLICVRRSGVMWISVADAV